MLEPLGESFIDSNKLIQLLLDLAHEHSLESLLNNLVRRAIDRPSIECAQIWLIGKGDRCSTCPLRERCSDQSSCLHLAAGTSKRLIGGSLASKPEGITRIPLGVGLFGTVAATGEEMHENVTSEWSDGVIQRWELGQIKEVGGTPITFKGEILGIIVAFINQDIPDEVRPWGRIFADRIGAAIANARAFDEIQRLKTQLELQNSYLQEEVIEAKAFGGLVGQSTALRQIISQIDLVAPTDASVLILGETGTGKELVAHEIHQRSARKDRPLIRVNCASIPRELFESEFFGHVRGAFTGALKDRAGRFETAEGGTLFLDEIGEVPLEMQGKLLRVLQEKRYERVGEDRTRYADVRIIGATNRDLKKAVAAGRFREDLYYRLHVFPIQVTPLRERKDDIPLLAKYFLELSVRELKYVKPRLTRAGLTKLQQYDWPGNIRELRNVIERAVILARGGTLDFDLPTEGSAASGLRSSPRVDLDSEQEFLTQAELDHRERENLLAILRKANWRVKGPEGAAELLGVKPTTLFSRMKRMGIKPPSL